MPEEANLVEEFEKAIRLIHGLAMHCDKGVVVPWGIIRVWENMVESAKNEVN